MPSLVFATERVTEQLEAGDEERGSNLEKCREMRGAAEARLRSLRDPGAISKEKSLGQGIWFLSRGNV